MLECLGRLELLRANAGRFEINLLLFAEDTALGADSEEKLCRLVSEFGRACERRKLRVDVGMSKAMRCSSYGKVCRMHVILHKWRKVRGKGFFHVLGVASGS